MKENNMTIYDKIISFQVSQHNLRKIKHYFPQFMLTLKIISHTKVTTTLFTPTYMSQGFKNMSETAISAATHELELSAISCNIKETDKTVAAI